jgi:hypothetical protein
MYVRKDGFQRKDYMRKEILPINTSGRTKEQIVAEAEATWLLPTLIGDVAHGESCRCIACFHQHMDYVIAIGDMYANV